MTALLAPVSAAFPGTSAAAAATPLAGGYVSLPWARVLDTTTGLAAPKTPVAANGSVSFTVAGQGGVPATGAASVVLNFTAKSSRQPGVLTVYPAGAARPAGANLSFTTGATVSNVVTVALGTAGQVTVTNGSTGITAITADVLGYFASGTPSAAGAFTTLPSAHILDTTTGLGAPLAPVAANGTLSFTVGGQGGVPASGAASVVLNITAKASKAAGNFTVYSTGAAKPAGTNQTFATGVSISNLVTVALGTGGQVTIANGSTGTTAFTADVLGYFLSGTPSAAGTFASVPSTRVLDTATGVGAPAAPLAAHGSVNVTVAGHGGIPVSGASAVVLNLTAKSGTAAAALKAYATGAVKPAGAYLSFGVNQTVSEIAVVALAASGKITVNSTSTGTVGVSADVLGYIIGADTAPPGPVTAVTAAGAPSSVALKWINPTDADFAGVMIRRAVGAAAPASITAGTLVADIAAPNTTTTDSGLAANTKYSYALFAHDAVPNYAAAAKVTYTVPAAPTVKKLAPVTGPAAGGTAVTITGTNFTGATVVRFGTVVATFTITNATTIAASAPAGTGVVDVSVTTNGGASAVLAADKYTYLGAPPPPPPAPTVTSLNPTSGPTTGANAVTITGTNFTGATAVKFGTTPAAFSVTNATTIAATAPAGTGTVDVTVTTSGGTSTTSAGDQYTYIAPPPPPAPTVASLSPASGPTTGATAVTITGTNFTGATAVKFGTTPAAFSVTNATTIAATAPAGNGTIDVTVTGGGGTSAVTVSDQYTYLAPPPPPAPTVTGLSPTSGPTAGGTPVTIAGTNLSAATSVKFGTTAAVFTVANSTSISTTAPAGTGTVDVTVTTNGATSTTNAGDHYTYVSAPPGTIPSPVAGGWQLNGTAQVIAAATPANLQLTPATNWVSGSAFYPTPVPGAGITASFDAYIGPGSGADGMTFTLADASVTQPTTIGDNGGGEGFSGIKGVALSLDTWQNDSDPSSNFVGIATATTPVQSLTYAATNATIPSLINAVHHYVVTTSATGVIVTMDGTPVLNYAVSLPPYVLVGFTAATGGYNDIHQVQNVSIIAGSPPPAPTVTAVSPNSGPNTAGTTVAITGTNFYGVGGVNFGASPATFTINSPTSITATAPAGTSTVDVTVANGSGTSAANLNDQYTFITGPPPPPPAPNVTGVSPATGPTSGGTDITVTGSHFTGSSSVNFGSNPATFVVTDDATIDVTAPAALVGVVDVTVTNAGGTSGTNPSDQYTYFAGPPQLPTITSVDPVNGPAGSLVTLGGTSYTTATAVHFGSAAATFTVNNDATITATAPAGSGTVDVTITNGAGTSAVDPDDDQFTYTAGPPPGTIPSPVSGAWQLNGTASNITGTTPANLLLTPTTNWVAGSAFYPIPAPGVGVTASFDAFIGPTAGADGMTFTLADASVTSPTALGSNGGGEGYAGINGIAVSLDHWQNNTDPSNNFVGIATATDGQQSLNYVTTNSSIPSLINSLHHFKVTTSSLGIVVTMDGVQVLNYGTILPQYVLLGFTAANGGFNDNHQIQNVAITAGPPPPVPTVTAVSPSSGPSTGATTVAITGSGLLSASAVNFGTTPATNFLIQNDNVITATAPAHNLGVTDVTVKTAGGTTATSAADKFTYVVPPVPTVTGVSPASGPSTGGTAVTLTGTGFAGATAINFGAGNPAIFYTVNSPTSISVTAPPGTLGLLDITVVTPGGTSPTSAADKFTYTVPPPPIVTSLSPTSGPNGTFITVHGSNFSGATAVKFGTVASTFTVNSPTSISANAPAGSGSVDLTVVTPGGTSTTNINDHFTYTVPDAPTVTSVSPSTGFSGYSIVIAGTNFTSASAVNFGANTATFTVNNDTSITATAPSGTGTVDVTVTTSGGVSTTGTVDQFTYLTGPPPPTQVATYRGDLARTGYYPNETGVNLANVATLKKHWTAAGSVSSFAQPIVANNLIYWGDWAGVEHATNFAGVDVWTVNTGVNTDESCSPSTAGVSGTVTIGQMGGTSVAYVPGGDNYMYALNALTGAVIWKTSLGTAPAWYLWSSPILFNGSLYEGIASFGDCPLIQGQLVQMNATTGAIQNTADMVADGCIGAGIWTSPTVDPLDGSIYVTTGTPNACHNPGVNLAPAIVKLRASDLAILSSWTVPVSEQQFGDEDFGGTPTLFTATIGGVQRPLVGALNKDGLFFAWDRSNLAAGPVWQSTIADPSGSPRSILSAAWDGKYLYVGGGGAIINGASCYGNLDALDPASGAFIWRSCQTSFMTAGITEVPGLLIEGVGAGGQVKFINTANGATTFTYNTGSTVQGEVTVFNGIVYVPLANGNLLALGQ
ncbi:MAG TPA: IPT/TIG domain-containing protein [Frankiaceae bacterium]|nr:IPT/TIG domain-containing protein [Frankiaceae bacterium]